MSKVVLLSGTETSKRHDFFRTWIDSSRPNYARIGVLYYGQTGSAFTHVPLTRYTLNVEKQNFRQEVLQAPYLSQFNTDVTTAMTTALQVPFIPSRLTNLSFKTWGNKNETSDT